MPRRKTKESESVARPPVSRKHKRLEREATKRAKKSTLPAVVAPAPVSLISLVKEAITNPAIDHNKMTGLVDWYTKRQADNAFARDFLAMAKHLPEIKRDGTIDHGTTQSGKKGVKAQYATYENIHEVTSEVLHAYGFTLSTTNRTESGVTFVVLTLEHYDPEFGSSTRESFRPLTIDPSGGKTAVQAEESGGQYLKRRMVINILNLRSRAPEDLDHDGGKPPKMLTTAEQKQIEEYALATECPLDRLLEYFKVKSTAMLDFHAAMSLMRQRESNKKAKHGPQELDNSEGS